MRTLCYTPEVQALLDSRAPVCCGVSGGKDSMAVASALARHLQDYEGPKLLLHANLGSVEWADSWPACQRMAEALGWEVDSCTRKAGGMMERWEGRWQSSIRRYTAMETVSVVLPWSTPAMKFCQSELKVDPISSYIKRRFGKQPVLNVTGVRAQESSSRAKQPICAPAPKLPPGSQSWRAIHHWTLEDVWAEIREAGIEAHEGYTLYGSTRISCRWCIMSSEHDMRASLKDPAGHPIYVRMCNLELESGFAFQGNRWLTSLAPELVPRGDMRLGMAKIVAERRKEYQDWVPKHLQFTKGWPHCVPTEEESEKLASMRRNICTLYGWSSPYLSAKTVRDRYQELWDIKQTKA